MSALEDYLGDGVYASFDGCAITLDLRAQGSDRITLELEVLGNLIAFAKRMGETIPGLIGGEFLPVEELRVEAAQADPATDSIEHLVAKTLIVGLEELLAIRKELSGIGDELAKIAFALTKPAIDIDELQSRGGI